MKRYFLILPVISLILTIAVIPVSAADLGGKRLINDANRLQNEASRQANQQQKKLSAVVQKADTLITNRINSLNNISARVANDKRLSSDERSSLNADIQTNITGLTTLKSKIDADTDTQTALTDSKQIITNFRVYAILEPKLRLLIMLNNLKTPISNLQGEIPQIQNIINTLQAQGKDVSALTPLLADINSQIQTINTSINNDIAAVNALKPTSTNAQATLTQTRQDIKINIVGNFGKIRGDIGKMRTAFHQIIAGGKASGATSSGTTAK